MGFIYIAKDVTKPEICKIGLTRGTAKKRISQTENPDYVLCHEFPAPDEQLNQIELTIHRYFESNYSRLNHRSSNRKSEWFKCNADEAYDILCSGAVSGISPVNAETGEKLNGDSHQATSNEAAEALLERFYIFEVRSVDSERSGVTVTQMEGLEDMDTFAAVVGMGTEVDDDRESYFIALDEEVFGGDVPAVFVEDEFCDYLDSRFFREVDDSTLKGNVFHCRPYEAFQLLRDNDLLSIFPMLLSDMEYELVGRGEDRYRYKLVSEQEEIKPENGYPQGIGYPQSNGYPQASGYQKGNSYPQEGFGFGLALSIAVVIVLCILSVFTG
ncbi:GIY-YIG nuclease family protein [Vibrio breoganii]